MMSASYALLVLLGAIWDASFLLIKIGTTEIAPMTFAFLRIITGAFTTGIVLIIATGGGVPGRSPLGASGGDGAPWDRVPLRPSAGYAVHPGNLSAILNGMMPIFTFLVVIIQHGERATLKRFIGVALGFAGTVILVLPQIQGQGNVGLYGVSAVIAAASLAVVYASRHVSHLPPQVASFGQLLTASVILLPVAIAEPSWRTALTLRSISAGLFLGVVGTSLAYLIYYRLIHDAGATFTSLVTYISPPFGVFWGWLILNEAITLNVLLALGLITCGLLLVRAAPRNSELALPPTMRKPSAKGA